MIASSSLSRGRAFSHFTIDILCWLLALILGIAIEGFLVIRILGIPISRVRGGGAPGIWIAQFLQPLVTLPILTLVLRWRGESWSSLGLRKPTNWRRFFRQTTVAMIILIGAGTLFAI